MSRSRQAPFKRRPPVTRVSRTPDPPAATRPPAPSATVAAPSAPPADDARLSLWTAAGQAQAGDFEAARAALHQALRSDADRQLVARLLIGSVYTSLGRAAILAEQPERGVRQLTAGLDLGVPGGSALWLDLLMAEAERCTRHGDDREAIQRWQDIACLLGARTPEHVYHRLSEAYARNREGFGGTPDENHCWGDCHKHDLLALMHEHLEPRLYLEIGVDAGLSLVRARGRAIGVDPRPALALQQPLSEQATLISLSSDAFFRERAATLLHPPPDLVFIDGMHLFEFALRDFMNVERHAHPATLVVIDDIYPCHPTQAARRRRSNSWTGDIWKLQRILRERRPDLTLIALNAHTTGLLLIAGLDPDNRVLWDDYEAIVRRYRDDQDPPPEVLERQGAIASRHPVVERLAGLLRQVRELGWSVSQVQAALRELAPLARLAEKILMSHARTQARRWTDARSRPRLVADRWDGLGARLNALLNAMACAEALGADFGLIWPRVDDPALLLMNQPSDLFSQDFLRQHECCGHDPAELRPINIAGTQTTDAAALRGGPLHAGLYRVAECFHVLSFSDDEPKAAQARFQRALSRIQWSTPIREVMLYLDSDAFPKTYAVLHVRSGAGCFSAGGWRQFTPFGKYLPALLIESVLAEWLRRDAEPLILTSDDPEYLDFLRSQFPGIMTAHDLIPGYRGLSALQQALVDLLVLSRAQRMVAPYTSAFSRLAMHLGGVEIARFETILEPDSLFASFPERARQRLPVAKAIPFLRPLLARDLCWYLDVSYDWNNAADQLQLAKLALRAEPDYCGAINRLVFALARVKPRTDISRLSATAAAAAQAVIERHADPMVETLVMRIEAQIVRLLQRLPSEDDMAAGRLDVMPVMETIRQDIASIEGLQPYQIQKQEVLRNLQFQTSVLDWVFDASGSVRRVFLRAFTEQLCDTERLAAWRPSAVSLLNACQGDFPQVLRYVEAVTIYLANALTTLFDPASSCSFQQGNIDAVPVSSAGLRWVRGWAYDSVLGGKCALVGYRVSEMVQAAGVLFLDRPDVVRVLNDDRALRSGFLIPIPLKAGAIRGQGSQLLVTP